MSKEIPATPMLDELESGPWPSFVSGLKRLAAAEDKPYAPMMKDLLGQLDAHTRRARAIGRAARLASRLWRRRHSALLRTRRRKFPDSAEFHTLRIMPPAGMHYTTDILRQLCDIWEKYGSGLVALHGQSGDIMFQGTRTANVQPCFEEFNALGFDLGGAGAARADLDFLRRRGPLRAVLLRRSAGPCAWSSTLPRRDAPPGAARTSSSSSSPAARMTAPTRSSAPTSP